ncbi:MAG: MarR family winged helix-turn-helix transcriptional regulator [Thermoplasmatota archaeon]
MDDALIRDLLVRIRTFTHVVHDKARQELPPAFSLQDMHLVKALISDGPLPQHRLAEVLGLSKGAVSQSVTRLVEAGLLERRRDTQDGRVQWVHPTPQLHAMRQEMEGRMTDLFADLFADWSDADAARFIGLLDQMIERAR